MSADAQKRQTRYRNAVRRVVLPRDYETPALKKEAKSTNWVALGHPKAMRGQEKEVLIALREIRDTCPNACSIILYDRTVTLTLGDDDKTGQYTGPDVYELVPTPFGSDVVPPARRRGFISPLNGLPGYTRNVTSIDLRIPLNTDVAPSAFAQLPAPIGSIVYASDTPGMTTDLLAIPAAVLRATGDDLGSLRSITMEYSSIVDVDGFDTFAQAFSNTPIQELVMTPSRQRNGDGYGMEGLRCLRCMCGTSEGTQKAGDGSAVANCAI